MTDGPDFLCIGQQKAGTTWLYDQLQFQPSFWMPPVKELHYLYHAFPHDKTLAELKRATGEPKKIEKWRANRQRDNQRPIDERDFAFFKTVQRLAEQEWSLDRYAELFEQKGGLLSGDISPTAALIPPAEIAALANRFPQTRIILLVRDPVERAWSNLNKGVRGGTIDAAELSDPERLRKRLANRALIRHSSATEILRDWSEHFAPTAIRVFLFDDIVARPDAVLEEVCAFLGAKHVGTALPAGFNRKADHKTMAIPRIAREALADLFHGELLAGAAQFGGAAGVWPARYGVGMPLVAP